MSFIELTDIKTIPDKYHDYTTEIKTNATPIIIDNGSRQCRVGWATNSQPLLQFRNLIAKPRKDRRKDNNATADATATTSPALQIGNDITTYESLRTQFDRNIVTHFHNQEQIFDYIFSHLSIDGDGSVPHPILLTEALANPTYCRQQMTELLFECYGVPSISYGIDCLFSWQHNRRQQQNADALIISLGYHTTHVIPVLNGELQPQHSRRINVGGYHIITYLFRLMQMKYPVHLTAITIARMETLIHNYGIVAVDYQEELRKWAQDEFYAENVKKIQLPYSPPNPGTTLSAEQRVERRRELTRRIIEINSKRQKEKNIEDEEQLQIMTNIRALHECGEVEKFNEALKQNDIEDIQELDKLMNGVRGRLERFKQRALMGPVETTREERKEKQPTIAQPPADIPIEEWLEDIKDKRSELLKRKRTRKIRRQDIAKRHTAAAQERMRIISLLARNEKGTDEFGRDDDDWNVYKKINRDNDSDSEVENEKLLELENILRHYDPMFSAEQTATANSQPPGLDIEHYQLHFGVEALRAPELLFQPSMIGSCEGGLAEVIQYVLKFFTADEQIRLATNVFLTGGCAKFPGLKERLDRELLEMRPFQTPHNIYVAECPELDAWLGACTFAKSEEFKTTSTTRKDYEENGSEYFRTHSASNFYFPSANQTK